MTTSSLSRPTVPLGLAPLDQQLGGVIAGRPYVVSGNPGAGKSVSCLEFVGAALERGERAAFVTHDDPRDVLDTADFLGLDLRRALRDERAMLLRFQFDFVRRMSRTPEMDRVFDELRDFLGAFAPTRLAIDSLVPLVEGGGNGALAMDALVATLDALGVTSLLTWPGDLTAAYDKRLEPLMQRAAGVFQLSSRVDGRRGGTIEIRKLRWAAANTSPVAFRIEAGLGFTAVSAQPTDDGDAIPAALRRALLALHFADPLPPDVLATLGQGFHVASRGDPGAVRPEELARTTGLLVLNVRRDVMLDALSFVRSLRRANCRVPIALLTPYQLRASDRMRALRAGADDFLSTQLSPGELLVRLEALVARGLSDAVPTTSSDAPLVLQPSPEPGRWEPLSRDDFVRALETHLGQSRAPFFTVVRATPADPEALAPLTALALALVRLDSGDLVARADDEVLLFLDASRPKDLRNFLQRFRDRWEADGRPPFELDVLSYPGDEERVRTAFDLGVAAG